MWGAHTWESAIGIGHDREHSAHGRILGGISQDSLKKAIVESKDESLGKYGRATLGRIILEWPFEDWEKHPDNSVKQALGSDNKGKIVEIFELYPFGHDAEVDGWGEKPKEPRYKKSFGGMGIAHKALIATLEDFRKHLEAHGVKPEDYHIFFMGEKPDSVDFFSKRGFEPVKAYPFLEFLEKLKKYKEK